MLTVPNRTEVCESGGIGRRARLRGVCSSTYGFKSRLSHQEEDSESESSFL